MVQVQLGDVGTAFDVSVYDQDGNLMDLSTATALYVIFLKPDGTNMVASATNPSTGKVRYVTRTGDLDQVGRWEIQAHIEMAGADWHTTVGKFKVLENLE